MASIEEIIAGRILFIGAHCDDIEIGCGGTAAKFKANGFPVAFATATPRCDGDAICETRKNEATKAAALLDLSVDKGNLFFGNLPDGGLHQDTTKVREWLKSVSTQFQPNTVFVHREDEHSDHKAIFQIATGVFQQKNVFLYPIPRPAPDIPFTGNCVIHISDFIEMKVAMCECHASQRQRPIYVSRDSVLTNAHACYLRWLGGPAVNEKGYAEEFQLRAWRQCVESVEPESSAPDSLAVRYDLQLVREPDGTLRWED
jgi:LmbE family N-acetylglucosaminyl deacetylase